MPAIEPEVKTEANPEIAALTKERNEMAKRMQEAYDATKRFEGIVAYLNQKIQDLQKEQG